MATTDLRGLLDHATAECFGAIESVYGRRLTARETSALRESLAALIRLIVDMPDPKPPPPIPIPALPVRERRPAQWFNPIRTNPGFKMPKKLPPAYPPPPPPRKPKPE